MKNFTTVFLLMISMFSFAQIPDWTWAKNSPIYFNSNEYSKADSEGNVYLIGSFLEPTLNIFGEVLTNTSVPKYTDVYIIKFDPDGNVLYSKVIGGPKNDDISAIAIDGAGNLYITSGITESITLDSATLTSADGASFIAKFSPDGELIWANRLTTQGSLAGVAQMTMDSSENIYIAGSYYGWAPTHIGDVFLEYPNYNPNASSSARNYVAKLDNQGNCLWAKAGVCDDESVFLNLGTCVAVDSEGSVYTGGMFFSMSLTFDDITITKSLQQTGNGNMFVVKYDNDGNALWADGAGSQYLNQTSTLAISTFGNHAYVSGYFTNSVVFGSTTLQAFSGSNLFTVKYDTDGSVLWAKKPFNSGGFSVVQSSDVDASGNLYIAGTFNDDSMNFGNGVVLTNPPVGGGAYVVKYSPEGTAIWGRKAGQLDANNTIAIDCVSSNEMYVSGTFYEPSLTFGGITLTEVPPTNYNAYIAKLYHAPLATATFDTTAFSMYPNPVREVLTIENLSEDSAYSLYNVAGKRILSGTFSTGSDSLYTGDLAAGVYLLRITSPIGTHTKKLIVD